MAEPLTHNAVCKDFFEKISAKTLSNYGMWIMKKSSEEFSSASIFKAEVGTTGPQGGDAGHGGETFFSLTDGAGTNWDITIFDEDGNETKVDQPGSIRLHVRGDSELSTLADSLEWAGREIRKLAK